MRSMYQPVSEGLPGNTVTNDLRGATEVISVALLRFARQIRIILNDETFSFHGLSSESMRRTLDAGSRKAYNSNIKKELRDIPQF